jgi:hypothetical protein
VHPVAVPGGRLVNHVPAEVHTEGFLGMTALPDQTREGLSKRLDEPVMRVTGGDTGAAEASTLEFADKPALPFGCPSEGRQKGRESAVGLSH